ncbi:hypothetical protein FS842_006467 [Serendipita sp. 407]|nr:hypothetical protein FS842_006467 [Serendipita sp. 407]
MSLILAAVIYAAPATSVPVNCSDTSVFQASGKYPALLWLSIAIAVITAFLQGLVSTLALIAESSNYWTLRFRLAKREHMWWTAVSIMLFFSWVLIIFSFIFGNYGESLGILALASATTLAIVQYAVPAWRARHYVLNRWLAWTGNSRTSVDLVHWRFAGTPTRWQTVSRNVEANRSIPSDWYGWTICDNSIRQDLMDILYSIQSWNIASDDFERPIPADTYIFDDGLDYDNADTPRRVSLLWGRPQNFSRRVSRAIASVPRTLMTSMPLSADGYRCEGVCLALGVLGRNKGLRPKLLVFDIGDLGTTFLEDTSTWAPRPSKVLRSAYKELIKTQYGGIGGMYVDAALELSLLFMDCPAIATTAWLTAECEHQDIKLNWLLRQTPGIELYELDAHYRSSYTSMIISLCYMRSSDALPMRPDLICTGLLLQAENKPRPSWWMQDEVVKRRRQEMDALKTTEKDTMPAHALIAAARLLGLSEYPSDFDGDWKEAVADQA